MTQNKHIKILHISLYFILALLTGLVMAFIMYRTEPNAEKNQVFIITWLFPSVFFLFSTISLYITPHIENTSQSHQLNQWNALWVVPFLLVGISWRFFGSWTLIFSMFYWLYVLTHMATLFSSRQLARKSVPLGRVDWLVLFIGLSALNIWQLKTISKADVLSGIANSFCMASITFICALLAATHSKKLFSGTAWQRSFLILVSLSVPVSMAFNKISCYPILALAISSWLILSESANKKLLIAGYILASFILILAPLALPEGVLITLWICILCILKNRANRTFEGILVPGGAIIFFLIGFFVAIVRLKGQVPAGNILYSFPKGIDGFGALFDRSKGLIPVAPWVLITIAGWLLMRPRRKLVQWVQWLGFPFILTGFVIFEWISYGKPPGWNHWLLMVPVIFPYYGAIWSKSLKPVTGSVIRVMMLYSLLISAILFVFLRFSGLDSVNLTEVLTGFSQRNEIKLSRLVPVFDHTLPGYSLTHWIWIGATVAFVLLLACLVRVPYRKSTERFKPGLMDTLFIAGIIGLTGLCFKAGQTWYVIPWESDIYLGSGETIRIDTEFNGDVYAVKILSDLSHSTHLPQGYTVAELYLKTLEDEASKLELQAGVHTAEWAYNRPDVLRDIQHQRPEPAWSWVVEETNGFTFSGMTYSGVFYLDTPQRISAISIKNLEQIDTNHVLTVKGLALMVHFDRNRWSEAQPLLEAPLLMSEKENIHTLKLPGDASYTRIILDSALANASIAPTGTPIGRITIKNKDKSILTWIIKTGIDTAEWSADRPDIAGKIRHGLPTIAYSERRSHHSVNYLAHVYRSRWAHDLPFIPTEILIEYLPGETEIPGGEWILHRLVLR